MYRGVCGACTEGYVVRYRGGMCTFEGTRFYLPVNVYVRMYPNT